MTRRPSRKARRNPSGVELSPGSAEATVYYRGLLWGICDSIVGKIQRDSLRHHENPRAALYRLVGTLCRDILAGKLVETLWQYETATRAPEIAGVYQRHAEALAVRFAQYFEAYATREEVREVRGMRALTDMGSTSGAVPALDQALGALQRAVLNAKSDLYQEQDHAGRLKFDVAIVNFVEAMKKYRPKLAKPLALLPTAQGFQPPRSEWPPAKPRFEKL